MTDRELLQQALDVMEDLGIKEAQEVSEAIRTRLAQPKKEWVGLTDEEIYTTQEDQSLFIDDMFDLMGYTKVIETKLKEKNT
jgi:hypothetical protein